MSLQQLPTETRIAIWQAHGKRCVYCGEQIPFKELEIDHVIPESLAGNPTDLDRVITELGLPPDFQLTSLLNLVPAHERCNSIKRSRIFQANNVRFFLENASAKEANVRRNIDALKLQSQKDKVLSSVRVAIDSGSLTPQEIHDALNNPSAFSLGQAIEFADGSDITSVKQSEIEGLLDKPILIGGRAEFVAEFVSANGSKMSVHTCREYRAAQAGKYYAQTTYDIKSEAFLKTANAILDAVARATVPTISYVSTPYAGIADLQLLPKEILPALSPDDEQAIAAMEEISLSKLAQNGQIKIVNVSSKQIDIQWGGWGAYISELLRADLDGDGSEEILIQYYTYAIAGTHGHGDVLILRRTGPNQMFTFERFE
jgi:5-methylcytosine-specific restriction endonuclease McrA